jgi:hypothetical protein
MYTQLAVLPDEEARAEALAMLDRIKYRKFMEAAESFAIENELIVGGPGATRLLLGSPRDPSLPPPLTLGSFQYDFYSGHAPRMARALGDRLYQQAPEGLGHYVAVITKVPERHLSIEVDGRPMFTITSLPEYRGIRIADVVIPTRRHAQFVSRVGEQAPPQLACMGPELQLIDLYAALSNPSRAGDWGAFLATEVRLRALFQEEIRGKLAAALAKPVPEVRGGRSSQRANLYQIVYDKFAAGPSRVLVGSAAIALTVGMGANAIGKSNREYDRPFDRLFDRLLDHRLQLVTAEDLEAEVGELVRLAHVKGIELQWTLNDPKIPVDPRLRRLTVYITGDASSRREPVLDLYNAAAHELVPFVTLQGLRTGGARGMRGTQGAPREPWRPPAALKVGTPFVVLRFRLVDIWTMQVLVRMGSITPAYAEGVLREMLADYELMAASYETALKRAARDAARAAAELMPASSYIGRLEAPELAARRAAQSRPGARFYSPYLPAANAISARAEGGTTSEDAEEKS